MRLVLQRVKEAQVSVQGEVVGRIGAGVLAFLGVAKDDTQDDVRLLARKAAEFRMFDDAQGKMNLSAIEIRAGFLIVSQFTLMADCRKGRRPSFDSAAGPDLAQSLYQNFVEEMKNYQVTVATGRFRAMMEVALVNDGPVTFILDSR